jgi:flagellar hook assembly protein FlgD
LSDLSFTPRVFSPHGTFGNSQVGIGFTLGRSAPVTVRVYNRAGRLMREVAAGETLPAGSNLVRWDGRDRDGSIVEDGLYLVTVEALSETRKSPLAVVR